MKNKPNFFSLNLNCNTPTVKTRCIIFCILLWQSLVLNAQYFALAKSKEYFYSKVLQYPQDGKYRVLVYNKAYDWNNIFLNLKPLPYILVYNSSFQLTDSIVLPKNICKNIWLFHHGQPVKDGGKLLWSCLSSDTLPNSPYRASVLELDTLYHPVGIHQFGAPQYGTGYNMLGMVSFPNCYVAATFSSSITRFYKLDKNFNKLDSLDTVIGSYTCFESNKGYGNKATFAAYAQYCGNAGARKVLTMDTALQITSCMSFSPALDTCNGLVATGNPYQTGTGVLALSSTKFFIYSDYEQACSISPVIRQRAIVNLIIDNNQQLVKKNKFSVPPANLGYIGEGNYGKHYNYPVAVKQPYIITIAGIGFDEQIDPTYYNFFPPFWPYFSNQKTKMLVTKMDTMGNVIWKKTYGGEMSYFPNSVAFTADGGCVIAGTRHDSTSMFANQSENFLLKLDSMGNYPGMDVVINELNDESLELRVYPNPANTEIYFDVSNEKVFDVEIYNTLGQLLLSKSNYASRSAINISQLNKDLYFYKVKTPKNNYTGKFVKE